MEQGQEGQSITGGELLLGGGSPAAAELGELGQSGAEAAGTIWCGYRMGKRGAGKAGRLKGRAGDHDAGQRKIPTISARFGRGRCATGETDLAGGVTASAAHAGLRRGRGGLGCGVGRACGEGERGLRKQAGASWA